MNATEALKKVREDNKTKAENFLLVQLSYSTKVLLPYTQGIELLQALAKAEMLTDEYSAAPTITAINQDTMSVRIYSRQEYEHVKMAQLLGLDKEQYRHMVENANKPRQTETA